MLKLWFDICWIVCGLPGLRGLRRTRLYNYRKKLIALRAIHPYKSVRMIKGGWNIGFITDGEYVFKIRKFYESNDEKIRREKRITDAFESIVNISIPHVEIIDAGKYTFYRYGFIPGKNLNTFSARTIKMHRDALGRTIGEFIYKMHNARPAAIADLMTGDGDGWNHNDICNNILVDPKTMRITGIIDWEYSGWGKLSTEFENTVRFKKKIKDSGMLDVIKSTYQYLSRLAHDQ